MKVQILGTGCPKCEALTRNVERALQDLGIAAEIEKVDKIVDIARMGVMMTPGLAIDGQVRATGHVLTVPELKDLLLATAAARASE